MHLQSNKPKDQHNIHKIYYEFYSDSTYGSSQSLLKNLGETITPKSLEVSEPSEVKKSYGAIQQELINMANKDKANDFKKPSNYECVDFVSRVDNQRSIPNVLAKKQAYHHGDVNLRDAIIAMAHDFVGSNNMARIVCLLMDMRKVGVPNYNPRDIVNNLKRLINNEDSIPMHPWYRGFQVTLLMIIL
ncbi:18480_t:CDS:2 [Funneliformis geosporum]|nr:18480_t:CDS:2 [Funneliformis geosporum]